MQRPVLRQHFLSIFFIVCYTDSSYTTYVRLLAYRERCYEGYIWEKTIDSTDTGISTISVMNAAAKQGIDFRYITKNNAEAELSKCNITESVKNEVRNFVNMGLLVELVPETLVIGDWKGTAYIAIDLKSGSASYMISGGTAGGSSMEFEDLFVLNNSLFLFNFELADMSLMTGYVTFLRGRISMDGHEMASGVQGMIGAAFSMGSALNMRYANYNYIFEYAERGEECMLEYALFTMRNMLDTIINIMTFVMQLCGEQASQLASSIYATYYAEWLGVDIGTAIANGDPVFTKDNIFNGMSTIWNLLGVWLTHM